MITHRDVTCLNKLAPLAQLLEMLGGIEQPAVRTPEVFLAMSRDVWRVYWFLSARLGDELLAHSGAPCDDAYFAALERRVEQALERDHACLPGEHCRRCE
ncbi:hypothetical protein NNJEOMEG_00181 [Fundidesulfovibrio magnetotacticus]|uniref:Uncharacterized protein n=1 Tax=Fundidesulfovibrio magnetotacticus TaxID=2730080 RepID=A0A6V8LRF5_9BACT|nr:hypothetical protein [Fundidesulfovibrio magnetotacticus]GFK92356.1 hypothetical protein NNJEOMEG_00181 [Fundidesulfovibrio magnetotacticus]